MTTPRTVFISASFGVARDPRRPERFELVPVRLAHQLEGCERQARLLLVDLRHCESHMDQHPVPGLERFVLQQPYIDYPGHPGHVRACELVVGIDEFDDPARYSETHLAVLSAPVLDRLEH